MKIWLHENLPDENLPPKICPMKVCLRKFARCENLPEKICRAKICPPLAKMKLGSFSSINVEHKINDIYSTS